jgi:antitoxin component YwqK of YwqJK toxin-antitoxin module
MEENPVCYICYEPETENNVYVKEPSPCICKGSNVIHTICFQNILKSSRICTICKTKYNLAYLPKRNGLELITKMEINGNTIEYTINEKGEKHGTYKIKNKEGRTISIHSYINDIMEGPSIEYYENGQIKSVYKCRNNRIEGEYSEWYEDGTIMEESHYTNGLKHGECVKWNKEGAIRIGITIHYIEGELQDEDY